MPFILLNEKNKDETEIWVNPDHIISMKSYDDKYTHVRLLGAGEVNPYTVQVIQHPRAIIGRIRDAYDGTDD